jgi:hypothetical protein
MWRADPRDPYEIMQRGACLGAHILLVDWSNGPDRSTKDTPTRVAYSYRPFNDLVLRHLTHAVRKQPPHHTYLPFLQPNGVRRHPRAALTHRTFCVSEIRPLRLWHPLNLMASSNKALVTCLHEGRLFLPSPCHQ